MNSASSSHGIRSTPNSAAPEVPGADVVPTNPTNTVNAITDSGSLNQDEEQALIDEASAEADIDLTSMLAQLAHAETVADGAEDRLDALIAQLDGILEGLDDAEVDTSVHISGNGADNECGEHGKASGRATQGDEPTETDA